MSGSLEAKFFFPGHFVGTISGCEVASVAAAPRIYATSIVYYLMRPCLVLDGFLEIFDSTIVQQIDLEKTHWSILNDCYRTIRSQLLAIVMS